MTFPSDALNRFYDGGASAPAQRRVEISQKPVPPIFYERPAEWRQAVNRRMNELMALPYGWDGYQGKPTKPENVAFAINMLEAICENGTIAPQIVPGADGDLQVEWHTETGDLELDVIRPNLVEAWFSFGDEEKSETLSSDFRLASAWLALITEANFATERAAA